MNSELFTNLAARLRENPSYFEAVDESLLGDLIFSWHEGSLSTANALSLLGGGF